MRKRKSQFHARRGFTFMELAVTVAIIAILGTVTLVNLAGRRRRGELDGTAQRIASLLREAQTQSMNGSQNAAWGVHFDNNTTTGAFYSLYYSSYTTSTRMNFYPLPETVIYVTSSLAQGASSNVAFVLSSGRAVASTSIRLVGRVDRAASATISVASSGAVSY